jgi:hypothetical protein
MKKLSVVMLSGLFLVSCLPVTSSKQLYHAVPPEKHAALASEQGWVIDSAGAPVYALNKAEIDRIRQTKKRRVFYLYDSGCDDYPARTNLKLFQNILGAPNTDYFFVLTNYDWGAMQELPKIPGAKKVFVLDEGQFGHSVFSKRKKMVETLSGSQFPKSRFSTVDYLVLNEENKLVFLSSKNTTLFDLREALGLTRYWAGFVPPVKN